jgi:hypothetical protein
VSHQLINCVYLGAGGTIESWVGRLGEGVTGCVTSADLMCLPGGMGAQYDVGGRVTIQLMSIYLVAEVHLKERVRPGGGVGGRVTIS